MMKSPSTIHTEESSIGYPIGWETFHTHFDRRRDDVSYAATVLFGNRFRMAHCFQGLKMKGNYTEPTLRSYEALLGFTLAWSAMEQLFRVCNSAGMERKVESDKYFFHDAIFQQFRKQPAEAIIKDYRANNLLHEMLIKNIESRNKILRVSLDELYHGKNNNLRVLGTALRNAFTHGAFAAHTGGRPNTTARICRKMRELLLSSIEKTFAVWVNEMMRDSQKKKVSIVRSTDTRGFCL